MQILSCKNLTSIFQSNMLARFQNLKELSVEDCGSLEQVFELQGLNFEERHVVAAIQLKTLFLKHLPKLKHVWNKDPRPFFSFQNLQKVAIMECETLRSVFPYSIIANFTQLETLTIDRCGVEEIFGGEEVAHEIFSKTFDKLRVVEMKGCKLESMRIISCKNLMSIFQSNMLTRFQNLKELSIEDCGSLEQVFELQELNFEERHAVAAIQLKTLSLKRLPKLRHVWNKDPCPFFSFQNLQKVAIMECETLRSVFPSSITASFPQLETLTIDRCGVEEIFGGEEVAHEILGQLSSKTFSKLRVVEMTACDKLKFFISLSIASCLSQLEKLMIRDCSNITAIVEGKIEERHITLFPKLHCITLEKLPKLMSFLSSQHSSATNAGEIIPKVKLDCCMQILRGKVLFPMLKELELCMIGVEDIQHKQHQAESSCKLTNMPTTSNFQNLSDLRVEGLGNIKHLLSFFTAKLMVHLESLSIRRCEVLEEILGEEEEVVLFPRLKKLSLIHLLALKRFCMGSNINFPSLEKLVIDNCPRMKTFICKPIHLDMAASSNLKEICAGDGFHTVMEPLFNELVAFPDLEELKICKMVELKIIWESQFTIDSCRKLKFICIESCENLTSIFQFNMLARFQNLKKLFVRDCGSLEQVFELQGLNVVKRHAEIAIQLEKLVLLDLPKLRHVWDMDPHPFFSFQNLQDVLAINCESLKSLFPASMARRFMQLKHLIIAKCGLEEIISRDEAAHAMDRLMFPQVESLHLEELPRLEWFQPGVHTSEWPMLERIWVKGCPFACAPQSNERTLEEYQHEICNKQLHFLFDKNQEVQVERVFDQEELEEELKDLFDREETFDLEDSEEEEDEGSS